VNCDVPPPSPSCLLRPEWAIAELWISGQIKIKSKSKTLCVNFRYLETCAKADAPTGPQRLQRRNVAGSGTTCDDRGLIVKRLLLSPTLTLPFLAGVCLAILLPGAATAVLFEPLSIEALAGKAEIVIQGTVRGKTCQRDAAGRIFTRVEVEVTDLWKGAVAGSPLVIVQGGGTVGPEESRPSGQVHYDVGEEVVCFLVRNGRGEAVTVGLMQGKFHVWKDGAGSRFAANPFHGAPAEAASPLRVKSSGIGPGATPSVLSVAELRQRVLEVTR